MIIKTNHSSLLRRFALFCVASFFMSCQGFLYDETLSIQEETWTYNQPLSFSFEVQDTSKRYNLYLEIKHRSDYLNQNVYAKLYTETPGGKKGEEQVSLELATPEGAWIGQCKGNYCISRQFVREPKVKFEEIGNYKLKFEQFSRQDSLNGIHSLRIMMEEAKEQ